MNLVRTHPRWPGIVAGIVAALAFLFVVSIPILYVWAWSEAHCHPKPDCRLSAERAVVIELVVIAGPAALAGASVRSLVDWTVRRQRGETQAPAPRWAAICLILLGLAVLSAGPILFGFEK